jgi:uncharacterized repeat protein (TIGR02543 family)
MVSFSVTARTVLPQVVLADVASYKLLGELNGAAETELAEFITGETTIEETTIFLESGTWNFTLDAYNDDDVHILQGIVANKRISLAEPNQVSFSLLGVNSGTGTIEITLNFPPSAGITRIVVKSDPDSEDLSEDYSPPTGSGEFIYIKDVAAGDYLLHFELYRGEMLRTFVSEQVKVRGNLTSSKTITLVGDNLKPLPTAEIVIGLNINEWELTEQTALATADVDKIFTVTGTYTTYQWYLDGISAGSSSSYTFNKSAGVYQLVVVATNSAGERRSGRCRIAIASPLSANIWTDGNITDVNNEDWYSFPVVPGTPYRIWWNDRKEGSGKTGDIAVGARYENAATFIFGGTNTTVDSGWTTPQQFTANQDGMVYIRVIPYQSTGTYGIVYSDTTSTRPAIYAVTFNANGGSGAPAAQMVTPGSSVTLPVLSRSGYIFGGWNTAANGTGTYYDAGDSYTPTGDITFYANWSGGSLTENIWANDRLTTGTSDIRYSFTVTSERRYYVWWNDYYQGNGTKSLDVRVRAQYSNGDSIFSSVDSGYNTAQSFTANRTGTVYLIVVPYTTGNTGTYGIVYSTGYTRPAP